MRLFWQPFYQSTGESEEESIEWSEISKKLTWKNQVDIFEYYKQGSLYEEIKKKASAWFRIAYEPWIIYMKKSRKAKRETNSHDSKDYLVLLGWCIQCYGKFLMKKRKIQRIIPKRRKKERKRKNKRKDAPILPNTTNGQN